MLKALLLSLLLFSCGVDYSCVYRGIRDNTDSKPGPCTVQQISPHINKGLMSYVSSFSHDAMLRNIPCYPTPSIDFRSGYPSDNEAMIGYCMLYSQIKFVREYWDMATAQTRRTLVYHELGHCALRLDHSKEDSFDIMNPYILSDNITREAWPELVNQLFSPRKKI